MSTLKDIQDTRLSQTYYTLNDIVQYNIKVLEYYDREINSIIDNDYTIKGKTISKIQTNNNRILKDIKVKTPIIKAVIEDIQKFERGLYYSTEFPKQIRIYLLKYKYLIPPFARINNIPFKL